MLMHVESGMRSKAGPAGDEGGRVRQCMRDAEHAALAQGGAVMRRAGGRTSMCREPGMMRRPGLGG